jgi:FkbM family methyltransferase
MNVFRDWSRKLALYFRAALETRSLNWRGLPVIPKRLSARLPHNRASYNEFLLWIRQSLQLRQARVIFDVGANHGDFSKAASVCFPQADVFLFEPLPLLRSILESEVTRHRNQWHFHPIALGASEGHLPLYVDPANDTIGSLAGFSESYNKMHNQSPNRSNTAKIEVPIESLDNFCQRERIGQIDLIKIDVEGFEFAVLDGSSEMLGNTKAIIIELSLVRKAEGKPEPLLDMVNRLTQYGFYIVALFPSFAPDENKQGRPQEYNILARRFDSKVRSNGRSSFVSCSQLSHLVFDNCNG